MTVSYRGKSQNIHFPRDLYDDIRAFYSLGSEKITLFLSAKKKGNTFAITNWYLPEQTSTEYTNVIPVDQLTIMGEDARDADDVIIPGESICGLIRGGGRDVKASFEQSDKMFLENVCNGMSNYFAINMDKDGRMFGVIADGLLQFNDVSISIPDEAFDSERLEELKKFKKEGISAPNYSRGTTTQGKRVKVVPSLLLTQDKRWEDVV